MEIAFIDDKKKNLVAWFKAMKLICGEQAILNTYRSIDEFEEAIQEGYQPKIVFTDYNIDDRCGVEVVEIVRKLFGRQVYIIAHSSQNWRNEHLLEVGADEIVPKYKGVCPSPTISDRFWAIDDLIEICEESVT